MATRIRKVEIVWSWEDIQKLRPDWTKKQCTEALWLVSSKLVDRSIECGWLVLDDLLNR